jgi:predicted SAM-dependent methyltransferase
MIASVVIDGLAQAISWARRRRRIVPGQAPVMVNLGSGLSVADGWIHVDGSLNALISTWPRPVLRVLYRWSDCRRWYSSEEYLRRLKGHRFVHHRMEYGVPFADESVEYVYTSHALEHLFRDDAEHVLADAYRALKRGGRIRIAVPDLERAFALYRAGETEKALGYFFATSRSRPHEQHRYLYDYELLKRLLEAAGFTEVERCEYRCGKVPDLDKLDNRPEETLFVEAIKP